MSFRIVANKGRLERTRLSACCARYSWTDRGEGSPHCYLGRRLTYPFRLKLSSSVSFAGSTPAKELPLNYMNGHED
jgi:hypothetical protein